MKKQRKMSLEELNEDPHLNWRAVFGDNTHVGGGGRVYDEPGSAVPGSDVSLERVDRKDVREILALWEGDDGGWSGIGLFRLRDGRYLVASGSAEYSGWDCGGGNDLVVAKTLAEAVVFGMSEVEAERLGLAPQRKLAESIFAGSSVK